MLLYMCSKHSSTSSRSLMSIHSERLRRSSQKTKWSYQKLWTPKRTQPFESYSRILWLRYHRVVGQQIKYYRRIIWINQNYLNCSSA